MSSNIAEKTPRRLNAALCAYDHGDQRALAKCATHALIEAVDDPEILIMAGYALLGEGRKRRSETEESNDD